MSIFYDDGGIAESPSDDWISTIDTDDDFDFGDLASDVGGYLLEGGENMLEWGKKNPMAVLGGVIGAGKSMIDYFGKEDAGPGSTERQVAYYKERGARHDQGMRDYNKQFEPKG